MCAVAVYYLTATFIGFHLWRSAAVLNDSGPLGFSGFSGVVLDTPAATGERVTLQGSLVNRSGLPATITALEFFAVDSPTGERWLEVSKLTLGHLANPEPGSGRALGRARPHEVLPFTAELEVIGQPAGSLSVQFFAARARYSWLALPLTAESTGIWVVQPHFSLEGG